MDVLFCLSIIHLSIKYRYVSSFLFEQGRINAGKCDLIRRFRREEERA